MHDFRYKNGEFYAEDVLVSDVAKEFGTPLYLYSHHTIIDHYKKIEKAFSSIKPLICYSMKANSNLAIVRSLVKAGSGIDIVSGGELIAAKYAGADPKKIVYASVGKRPDEIREAIKFGILLFNVESLAELEAINSIAGSLGVKQKVSLRLNPDVKVDTHKYITTGQAQYKFGIDFGTAKKIILDSARLKNIKIAGLHIHIGSQIIEVTPYKNAILKVLDFIKELKVDFEYLNIGGGLGIIYDKEEPQTAEDFAKSILPLLKGLKLKIILEPGRFIVGNSGILITKILYIKDTPIKRFIIVDAGMNDLARPSLYGAYHSIIPLIEKKNAHLRDADIVGPICESGDFLAKARPMPPVAMGEFLVAMGAGAYGYSMSSNYNFRPRVAEVMVMKNKFFLIRNRETIKDLFKNQVIPAELFGPTYQAAIDKLKKLSPLALFKLTKKNLKEILK